MKNNICQVIFLTFYILSNYFTKQMIFTFYKSKIPSLMFLFFVEEEHGTVKPN